MNQETYGPPPLAPGEPHLACVLLLDTSSSMSYRDPDKPDRVPPIDSLNQALQRFKEQVSLDEMAQKRVDIAIVEFNSNVRVVQDFTPIRNMEPITLEATGVTSMGAGINMAIDMVKGRNRYYNGIGTPVFKPWIFMITDGEPTDSIDEAARRIQEEESKGTHGKLKFFALGVEGYSKEAMFRLTNRVMELRDKDFSSIFDWMGKSMVAISVSRVGDEAALPMLPENARKADPNRDVSTW